MEFKKPCVHCGGEAVYTQYTHVEDVAGVRVTDPRQLAYVCGACGEAQLSTGELAGFQRRAAMTALCDLPSVQGGVLRYARKAAGLRQADLALLLGLSPETVSRYETSGEDVPRAVQMAMHGLLLAREGGADLRALIANAQKSTSATELVVPPSHRAA